MPPAGFHALAHGGIAFDLSGDKADASKAWTVEVVPVEGIALRREGTVLVSAEEGLSAESKHVTVDGPVKVRNGALLELEGDYQHVGVDPRLVSGLVIRQPRLSPGAIAGIVIGSVLGAGLIGVTTAAVVLVGECSPNCFGGGSFY